MATLTTLVAQYPILSILSPFLSTLDLFNLALTNRTHHSYILASRATFDALRRDSLCDGSGLVLRQEFVGLHSLPFRYTGSRIAEDEPVEVQLYSTKCDEVGALPCRKCGINICEECRYYLRIPPEPDRPVRCPHLDGDSWQNNNVMCLCAECDAKVEADEVVGKYFYELCDCDVYTRWICHKCVVDKSQFTDDYYEYNTISEDNYGLSEDEIWMRREIPKESKAMIDHGVEIMYFCPCGAKVPKDARPRCTWYKQRHLPESEWEREYYKVGSKMPIFDDDPCYPRYRRGLYTTSIYPPLPYNGPIWEVPE